MSMWRLIQFCDPRRRQSPEAGYVHVYLSSEQRQWNGQGNNPNSLRICNPLGSCIRPVPAQNDISGIIDELARRRQTWYARFPCLPPKLRHMLNCVKASYTVPAHFSTLALDRGRGYIDNRKVLRVKSR